MGNNASNIHNNVHSKSMLKLKLKSRKRPKSKPSESFFIEYHQSQQLNLNEYDIDLRKRVVFVSLLGLYQSWRSCPTPVLYSSIFILPLKREWVVSISRDNDKEGQNGEVVPNQILNDGEFVKLLLWKDEQGLVFWMKDEIKPLISSMETATATEIATKTKTMLPDFSEYDNDDSSPQETNEIAPFWKHLSMKLEKLYDPVNNAHYKPLILDTKWWSHNYDIYKSKYQTPVAHIISELSYLTMKFKSIQQILYESNPSLEIVTHFSLEKLSISSLSDDASSSQSSQKSYSILTDDVIIKNSSNENETETEMENIVAPSVVTQNEDMMNENVWFISSAYDDASDNEIDFRNFHDDDDVKQEEYKSRQINCHQSKIAPVQIKNMKTF